jgi:hypothetical protein
MEEKDMSNGHLSTFYAEVDKAKKAQFAAEAAKAKAEADAVTEASKWWAHRRTDPYVVGFEAERKKNCRGSSGVIVMHGRV